jgi:hypothetical protein
MNKFSYTAIISNEQNVCQEKNRPINKNRSKQIIYLTINVSYDRFLGNTGGKIMILKKNVEFSRADETVSWTLDFISKDLERLDLTERWKLGVDAYKYLRLWYVSSLKDEEFVFSKDPPKTDIRRLQAMLLDAFDKFLLPLIKWGKQTLIEGEKQKVISIPSPKEFAPKIFVADGEGYLYCIRSFQEDLEGIGVANFLDAVETLTPLSLGRFQQCEECERWFFPTGKRFRKERRFCSRDCNLRSTARSQRDRIKGKKSFIKKKGEN